MDTESIKEKVADAGQQVRHWMEDKHNRRCCKVAMGAANAVVLLGLLSPMLVFFSLVGVLAGVVLSVIFVVMLYRSWKAWDTLQMLRSLGR